MRSRRESELARFTKRRKDAYEALHPETKGGGVGRGGYEKGGQLVHSFAADTADKTGVDARTVRRDAERGEKVSEKALDLIRDTKLDTGTYLDKLKAMPVGEQVQCPTPSTA